MIDSVHFKEKVQLVEDKILEPEIADQLISHWEECLADREWYQRKHYFHYFTLLLSIQANFLYLQIYDRKNQKKLHEFGLKELLSFQPDKVVKGDSEGDKVVQHKNQGFYVWKKIYQHTDYSYSLLTVSPAKFDVKPHIIKLKHMFVYYYLTGTIQKDFVFQNLFRNINDHIVALAKDAAQRSQALRIVYFKFEPIKKFVEIAGEAFGDELERFILKTIAEKVKEKDMVCVLSPQEYFLISVDTIDEELEESFKDIRFQNKGLLLSYEIKFFTLKKEIDCVSDFWEEIKIE